MIFFWVKKFNVCGNDRGGKIFKGTRFCAPTGEMRLGKVQGFVGNAGDNANGG